MATARRLSAAERIVHSCRQLDEAQRLILVDIVEEVVEPPADDRRETLAEAPGEHRLDPGREREEVLPGQLGMAREGAPDGEEGDPRAERGRERIGQAHVAPERSPSPQLDEAQSDGRDAW